MSAKEGCKQRVAYLEGKQHNDNIGLKETPDGFFLLVIGVIPFGSGNNVTGSLSAGCLITVTPLSTHKEPCEVR